jgi:hypothetical protein
MTPVAIAANAVNARRLSGRMGGKVRNNGQRCVFLAALPGARAVTAVVMN